MSHRHCHTLASWVLANCSTTSGLNKAQWSNAICELDEDATVTSIDDTTSRRAMIAGLERVPGGSVASRFVRLFCSEPSAYLWEDTENVAHTIHQGEGGEQGDPLMPFLFSVGQHDALFADLDDNYLVGVQAGEGW